jgi:hypothetical protein
MTRKKIVFITIEDKTPDDLGRQHFWAQWMSNAIGKRKNETGLAGQIFFGNLKQHIKGWEEGGYTVEYCNSLKPNKNKLCNHPNLNYHFGCLSYNLTFCRQKCEFGISKEERP